nr:protein lin-37 homolog [Lytechinus pictus]
MIFLFYSYCRPFGDDIRELEATPVTKSPSKSKKRKKRDLNSSDVEQLDDNTKTRNSFVMKLFDRSVDLANFRANAPLYPVCRAWMDNTPNAKTPKIDLSPSPEPLPDSDMSENGLIYRLPSPSKTGSEMTEELSRDPRIPSPVPQPQETLDIHADSSQAPSKETLLKDHLQRWKVIRNKWKEASQLNQSRYSESYAILKAMYERQ